ncbi:hypothetical protein TB1_039644 [Malus domestica]
MALPSSTTKTTTSQRCGRTDCKILGNTRSGAEKEDDKPRNLPSEEGSQRRALSLRILRAFLPQLGLMAMQSARRCLCRKQW